MEITILSAIIGALTIIEYTLPLRETKPNIGNAFGAAVGIFVILDGALYNKANHMAEIIINGIFLIGIILFTAVMIYVVGGAKMTAKGESTLIVLGCRVKWDKPSLALVERCRAAAKYMKKNENAVAILSGGQGADENISEAECMYDLMQSFGVDKNRLFIESKSTSTDENIEFCKKIIEKNGLSNSIAIATSEYHIRRALMICKRHGLSAKAVPSKTVDYTKPPFYAREVFGVLAMWLKVK